MFQGNIREELQPKQAGMSVMLPKVLQDVLPNGRMSSFQGRKRMSDSKTLKGRSLPVKCVTVYLCLYFHERTD